MSHQHQSYRLDAGPLGQIEGLTITTDGAPAAHYFGGLPYALPPTGDWRFRVPRKLPPGYKYGTESQPGQFTRGTWACPQPPSSNTPDDSLVNEDCLQLNIWVPARRPAPKDGWPVCFYIHGGFLQVGNPNLGPNALAPLLGGSGSAFEAIMVLPSYRLNAFGFLTGRELAAEASARGEAAGNMGLWDQRAALEWTHSNISWFGGNPENITVAGYSAGAYSAFQQLAHEICRVPADKAFIRRVAMFSNGPGVQPKELQDHQEQFDELLSRLGIAADLEDGVKLARLRDLPHHRIVQVQGEMKISEFRVLADDAFYPRDLFDSINNGQFAERMKSRGLTLINGECEEEHTMYRRWRTPRDSYTSVHDRLYAEYGPKVTRALMSHYCGWSTDRLPTGYTSWQDFFGRLYAGIQVHYLERGFHHALFQGGLQPGRDILRYRIERRLSCVEERIPTEWGVTHLTDIPIWLWGADYKAGLSPHEKELLKEWNECFAAFVKGEPVAWGTTKPSQLRRWRSDGQTDVCEDLLWEEGKLFWSIVNSGSAGAD